MTVAASHYCVCEHEPPGEGSAGRFEGFGAEFSGDGIVPLFGAPIAHENHA